MRTTLSFERRSQVVQQPGLGRIKAILDSLPVLPGVADAPSVRTINDFVSRVAVQGSTWKPQYYAVLAAAAVNTVSDIPQILQGLDTDTWDVEIFPQAGIGAAVGIVLQQSAFVANETPYNILVQRNSVYWPPEPLQQFTQNVGAIIANMGLDAYVPPVIPPPDPESRLNVYRRNSFVFRNVVMQ